MSQADRKRQTGYSELLLVQYCGKCRNCTRRGTHLRCLKFDYPVTQLAICRAGFEPHDPQMNHEEHPLFVKEDVEVHNDQA